MTREVIGIIGLGYVGLPLAVAFAQKGNRVVGFDTNARRIRELNDNNDITGEVSQQELAGIGGKLAYTDDVSDLSAAHYYIVTVPTPVDKHHKPDLNPLVSASELVAGVMSKGDIVVYESTVYPGVTEEVCVPVLERVSGLKFNVDFYCGYSPERINPGDKFRKVTDIVKVTSGSTPKIADQIDQLYQSIVTVGTHKAPSIKVAEASKVIENTQRDLNIALMNELSIIFDNMNIDTMEVLEAAGTKWNFLKFAPGLVGGHCIGVDPYYLTHRSQELGYTPNLILSARYINNGMSQFVAEKAIKLLIQNEKKIKNGKVLILGYTFKENCPDIRNTKVQDLCFKLNEFGVSVDIFDPWVSEPHLDQVGHFLNREEISNNKYECIIVAVAHDEFTAFDTGYFEKISNGKPLVLDLKGIVERPDWRL